MSDQQGAGAGSPERNARRLEAIHVLDAIMESFGMRPDPWVCDEPLNCSHQCAETVDAIARIIDEVERNARESAAAQLAQVQAERDEAREVWRRLRAASPATVEAVEREAAGLPPLPRCDNFCPPEWTGPWRDWHRGHGCDLDPDARRAPQEKP